MPPKGQPDQRRNLNAKDQFGRSWGLTIEIATGAPTGVICPAGWGDPMNTPQKYMKVPKDEHGQPMWGRIEVDFTTWLDEQVQREREWRVQLWQIGQDKLGVKFDAKSAEEDEYLLHLVGPKPWPSSAAILAAMEGDPALLGLTEMTPRGRKMLGIVRLEDLVERAPVEAQPELREEVVNLTYREFVSRMSKAGKNLKDISAAWQEHKAALKEH